jgi:hypothetical protein
MQTNQNIKENEFNIIEDSVWEELYSQILILNSDSKTDAKTDTKTDTKKHTNLLTNKIYNISLTYNIDKKNIIKDFLNYIIRNKEENVTSKFLDFIENIVHFQDCKNNHYVNYALLRTASLIESPSS